MQAALDGELTDEERRRNSRRLDLVYMLSSHPLAPDAYEVAEGGTNSSQGKDMDAAAVGEVPCWQKGKDALFDGPLTFCMSSITKSKALDCTCASQH